MFMLQSYTSNLNMAVNFCRYKTSILQRMQLNLYLQRKMRNRREPVVPFFLFKPR